MKKLTLSFQAQIFWALLLFLILPTVLLGVISSNRTATTLSKQYRDTLNSITKQISLNLDTLLKDAEKICSLHLLNDDVRKVLSRDYKDDMYLYAKDSHLMTTQISQANRLNSNVLLSLIRNKYGYTFEYGFSNAADQIQALSSMDEMAALSRKDPHLTYVGQFFRRQYSGNVYRNIVPMVKILTDPFDNYKEIGVFYLGINFNAVANILESSELPNSKLAFVNRENEVFFSPDQTFLSDPENQTLLDEFSRLSANITAENPNGSYNISDVDMQYDVNIMFNQSTGWKIVHYMDNSIVQSAYASNTKFFLTILIISIMFGLFLAYYISRRLTRSISSLCAQIDACEGGDVNSIQLAKSAPNRELLKVITSYNRLNQRLSESIRQNYARSLDDKKIKLKMLQMQIDPHFLYNTLNIISALANIHDIPEIKTIAGSMSDILRYNLKSGPIVELSDEIVQIDKYISIQQLRFPGKFIFEHAEPAELTHIHIPAFILQPIVENAISHGLEKKESDGYIGINIYRDEKDLHILISDNGCGMDSDTLEALTSSLSQESVLNIAAVSSNAVAASATAALAKTAAASIGIVNVHQRIQAYYGREYGLSIKSTPQKGTLVDIRLPMDKTPNLPDGLYPWEQVK